MGVSFGDSIRLRAPHYGLFWERIRGEFPRLEEHPPILGDRAPGERVQVLKDVPLPREFFISEDGTRIVQLQATRFIHNWRRMADSDVYPRYDTIKPDFFNHWHVFQEFLGKEGLGTPRVQKLELTYVNHILSGKLWQSLDNVNNVARFFNWPGPAHGFQLPNPSDISLNFRVPHEECGGHLVVKLTSGTRAKDDMPVLVLELSVQGEPVSSEEREISRWLDAAHDWIVRGFVQITEDTAHDYWELER